MQLRALQLFIYESLQIVFAGAVLEGLLHLYNPIPFRVKGNRIVLRRHERNTFRNPDAVKLDRIIEYRTNSLGFRGAEPPKDLPNRLSILTIGGSTTGCFMLN